MIPAIAQAVASILVSGTSLTSTEQIDFGCPGHDSHPRPCLNLYVYEIQEALPPATRPNSTTHPEHHPLHWFDVMFVLMARDHTPLGEQHMLSESLTLLLQHPYLPAALLSPPLQPYGDLPLGVAPFTLLGQSGFWQAMGIPLQPALQITVTTPFAIHVQARSPRLYTPLPHAPPYPTG